MVKERNNSLERKRSRTFIELEREKERTPIQSKERKGEVSEKGHLHPERPSPPFPKAVLNSEHVPIRRFHHHKQMHMSFNAHAHHVGGFHAWVMLLARCH